MSQTPSSQTALPLRIFRCNEGSEYAKFAMAFEDIKFTRSCLTKLRDMLSKDSCDNIICEALWNAAIIRFFSVFDGPNALRMDIINELPEGAPKVFKYFAEYRDKNIAHKVNPIDQIKPGVILSDPLSGEKKIEAVGYLSMSDASFADDKFLDSFGKLVEALSAKIEVDIKHLENELLQAASERPIDELYKLPPAKVVVPNSHYLQKNLEPSG